MRAQAASLLRLLVQTLNGTHTHTHTHTRYDPTGRGTGPSQTPLPGNTWHSQDTDFHTLGWIRTRNPSKRAAADTRLRPRGHRDRPLRVILTTFYMYFLSHTIFVCSVRLVLLDWITVVKVWCYEDVQCPVSPPPQFFPGFYPVNSRYFPQRLVFKYPHSVLMFNEGLLCKDILLSYLWHLIPYCMCCRCKLVWSYH